MSSIGIRWAFNSTRWQPCKQEWIRAAQCIQPEEKERTGKFVFKRDAKSSMVGRLMLRRLIHKMTNIPYGDIHLSRTEKGKPFLVNPLPPTCPHLSFNVSHQGDYVVLAAERDCEVGIDVMNSETTRMKTVPEFFHTMRRQFTVDEWQTIRAQGPEKNQLRTFYRLWCLKESYVKALGIGIGFEVQRLNFQLYTPLEDTHPVCNTTLRVDSAEATDWTFQETSLDNHCIAVALHHTTPPPYKRDHVPPVFSVLTPEELMDSCSPLSDPDDQYGDLFMNKHEDPISLSASKKAR